MANQFVGEIRAVGFNFAPAGWFLCQGQTLPISEYDVLFNLLGTTYGGDGVNTFALPNLQGRATIHQGTSVTGTAYVIGQVAGTESVTLTTATIPAHTHTISVQPAAGNVGSPSNAFLAGSADGQYAAAGSSAMAPMTTSGSSISHENRQPFQVVNFIIAWSGIYPSQG
jgi:microcystin-dependent protein